MILIGTADIKNLYAKVGSGSEPFLAVLDLLVRRGVEVRLLHAKEPGPNFRERGACKKNDEGDYKEYSKSKRIGN